MAVFDNLEERTASPPFDAVAYRRRLSTCMAIAQQMYLVHVSGRERPIEVTVQIPPHEIPTSDDHEYYTDFTRRAERLLGLRPSAYFYAGRAHPDFGNVALAFAADCEAPHTGSATPFDTGGLVHPDPRKRIQIHLNVADAESGQTTYGKSSVIALHEWREVFARVLAAYFAVDMDYWRGRPQPFDLEGLYERNTDWRAWTFEVRFHEGQPVHDRAAWCADEPTMEKLRRLLDEQSTIPEGDPPSPLERFLEGPVALEPSGTPTFCDRLEGWVREQVGVGP